MSDKREPMLSDEQIANGFDTDHQRGMTGYNVKAFYEDLIDKGVLMVVKEVDLGPVVSFDIPVLNNHGEVVSYDASMPCCGHTITSAETHAYSLWRFCPGCAARIKQA